MKIEEQKLVERDELSTILCTVVKVNYYFDRGIIILSTSTRSTLMKSLGPRLPPYTTVIHLVVKQMGDEQWRFESY